MNSKQRRKFIRNNHPKNGQRFNILYYGQPVVAKYCYQAYEYGIHWCTVNIEGMGIRRVRLADIKRGSPCM